MEEVLSGFCKTDNLRFSCIIYCYTNRQLYTCKNLRLRVSEFSFLRKSIERLCRAGPRGRARGRTTLRVHPLCWLLNNKRLEKVPFVSVPHTSSNRLLLSNQDKGCTSCVAHSLALPLGPALHNVWTKEEVPGYPHLRFSLTTFGTIPFPPG